VLLVQFLSLSYILFYFIEKKLHWKYLEKFEAFASAALVIWGVLLMVVTLRNFLDPLKTILRVLMVLWLFFLGKKTLENQRQEKSQVMLYEIFSFINNQLAAGLRLEDIIGNIHRVIEDKKMGRLFRERGEIFKENYDLELYLVELGRHFDPEEFFYVAYSLRNGFNLGMQQELLSYQQEIMFNNYIGIIIKKGDRNQIKLFFIALVQALALIIFVSYPIVIELMGSLDYLY